jgi:hypothetical protein
MSWKKYANDPPALAAYYLGAHNRRAGKNSLHDITPHLQANLDTRARRDELRTACQQGYDDESNDQTEIAAWRERMGPRERNASARLGSQHDSSPSAPT